jgi:glycosyltransferase involved in cell wall biosynthesis
VLPIGVLLPTRNVAALLPAHLDAMYQWLPIVEEVVVVDSFSQDGTLELLRERLRHPQLKFLQHPPGLYQSWNYGIRQLQARYCYISTVGDSVTHGGLEHLVKTLSTLDAEAAVSLPRFIDLQDRPLKSPGWPIEDIIATLRLSQPCRLDGPILFLFALVHFRRAILGSSASNLFRTATLQKFPFPVEFGTVGDGAWGLQHCMDIRLAITPLIFSTFREHPKSYSSAEYRVDDLGRKLLDLIIATYTEYSNHNPDFAAMAQRLNFDGILDLLRRHLGYQRELERSRRARYPWILNPGAWRARQRRNACSRRLDQLKLEALKHLCDTTNSGTSGSLLFAGTHSSIKTK